MVGGYADPYYGGGYYPDPYYGPGYYGAYGPTLYLGGLGGGYRSGYNYRGSYNRGGGYGYRSSSRSYGSGGYRGSRSSYGGSRRHR